MTDPTRDKIASGAADDPVRRHEHTAIYVAVAAASLMAVVLFVLYVGQRSTTKGLSDQVSGLTNAANVNAAGERALASQVRGLGGTPVVSAPVTVQQSVSQTAIENAVDRYFVAHPLPAGQLPPVSEVAGLVAQYLIANPPAPGQNATPQMVTVAVTGYCDAHGGCAGPAGVAGQNATDAQVQVEVAAYCDAHDQCRGPAGPSGATGPQGVPGPACPDGYRQRDAVITEPTTDPNDPLITATQVPGVACVATTTTTG